MKALKILGVVFGLLLVTAGVTLAIGIPGGFVTGVIEDRVEKETGYQLDINGGTTIKLWPLTVVTLSDVALFDPKDKSISQRFRAESIRAELSLRSLLTGNPLQRLRAQIGKQRVEAEHDGKFGLLAGGDIGLGHVWTPLPHCTRCGAPANI